MKLLDGPEGRVGQLDVDQFLVAAAGCVFLGLMLLGQSIAPSAQSGHLELLLLLLLLRGQQLNNTTLAVVVFVVVVVVVAVVLFGVESAVSRRERVEAVRRQTHATDKGNSQTDGRTNGTS